MKAVGWIIVLIVATFCVSYILDKFRQTFWFLKDASILTSKPPYDIWTIAAILIVILGGIASALILREELASSSK